MHAPTLAAGVAGALLGGVLLATPPPVTASTAPSTAPSTAASTSSCAGGYTTEQGTCAAPVEQHPLTGAQRRQRAEKDERISTLHAAFVAQASGRSADVAAASAPVRNYYLPEVARMTIFKEGQGNGRKSYTCGPAATRNMVAAMYEHADGSYKNISENQFAIWEGTTSNGTARANVAAALNNHFSRFGSWKTWRPSDRFAMLATIAADTHDYHQSVILNVDTEYYSFFNGKALNHFDFAYGYDNTNAAKRMVYVGEEWDPVFTYGSSSYGNPYGKHREQLWNVWQAVMHTSIHGIVA